MKPLPPHNDARAALTAAAKERILVLDGAMGTMIQQLRLDEAGYRGERFRDWLKDVRGNTLVDDVRRVAAGESLIDDAQRQQVRRDWGGGDGDPRLTSLSPQERRILQHIADGMTNRQIGETMSLAEKTVKNYVTAILSKLGMERRTQAAVFAATHPPQQQR